MQVLGATKNSAAVTFDAWHHGKTCSLEVLLFLKYIARKTFVRVTLLEKVELLIAQDRPPSDRLVATRQRMGGFQLECNRDLCDIIQTLL